MNRAQVPIPGVSWFLVIASFVLSPLLCAYFHKSTQYRANGDALPSATSAPVTQQQLSALFMALYNQQGQPMAGASVTPQLQCTYGHPVHHAVHVHSGFNPNQPQTGE